MEMLEIQKKNIVRALENTDWRISGSNGAAKLLGIPSTTLNSRIMKLGISKNS
jgi:transcriptional regulator with GAF, ATPase, and Fis domain